MPELSNTSYAQSVSEDLNKRNGDIQKWRQPLENKKIVFVGDSTTSNMPTTSITSYNINSGDLLEGVTSVNIVNKGSNGNTLAGHMSGADPGTDIDSVIALSPDLIVLSYGINDVRLGSTTTTAFTALLKSAIDKYLDETDSYIILRTPNSMLLDDPGDTGWVAPLASAQEYTDMLWTAYNSFYNYSNRVIVLDMQTLVFGRTCVNYADSTLMTDILHPNINGYDKLLDVVINVIGERNKISQDSIINAKLDNQTSPYLVYPKFLEDGDYKIIASGYFIGMGSSYVDFAYDGGKAFNIESGDILKVGDVLAYDLGSGTDAVASGNNTRILGNTFTDYAVNNKGVVKVFRANASSNPVTLSFSGNNISTKNLTAYTFQTKKMVTGLSIDNPIVVSDGVTFKLYKYNNRLIATITCYAGLANYSTVVWDATNAPDDKYQFDKDAVIYLECSSTSYTGDYTACLIIS